MKQHHQAYSVLYIAAIGTSASLDQRYWHEARKRFNYTESIALCGGKKIAEQAAKFFDRNTNVIIMESPFYGSDEYEEPIKQAVQIAKDLVIFYKEKHLEIEEIVVNSIGGTEKVSLAVRDIAMILKNLFPNVTHVFFACDGYNVRYSVKPNINLRDFLPPIVSFSVQPETIISTTNVFYSFITFAPKVTVWQLLQQIWQKLWS